MKWGPYRELGFLGEKGGEGNGEICPFKGECFFFISSQVFLSLPCLAAWDLEGADRLGSPHSALLEARLAVLSSMRRG